MIRSYPESMKSSSMVQLTMVVKSKDAPQLTLTCLSTIPGYLGHHVLDEDYADYRAATITGTWWSQKIRHFSLFSIRMHVEDREENENIYQIMNVAPTSGELANLIRRK